MKVAFILLVMCLCAHAVSKIWEKKYAAEANAVMLNDSQYLAMEAADGLSKELQHRAIPGTAVIDEGPDKLPNSRLRFMSQDGGEIAYFESKGSFYRKHEFKPVEKLLNDLSSAYFLPPRPGEQKAFTVELNVWKEIAEDNLRVVTVERQLSPSAFPPPAG